MRFISTGCTARTLFPSVVVYIQKRQIMASNRIPLYRVKGTHYECSRVIGVLTREAIRRRIDNDFDYLSPLFTFVKTDDGHKLHQDFIEKIRLLFPWYWDEIRGLADGSEIPLEQILVLNFLNETRTAYYLLEVNKKLIENEQKTDNETGEKGCSTVLINRKDSDLLSILHNEDHSKALFTTAYLIEADIQSSKYNNDICQGPNEKFISYCYAGSIPGNAFSANQHGFICTLNGLYPNYLGHGRLPRQIVNRALLSIKNEQELDELLHSSPVAYGFCVNGGFYHQSQHLLNYEIGPNMNKEDKNYISKCLIVNKDENISKTNDCSIALNYLIHYNHYERLDSVISQQKSLESSYKRCERGKEFGEIVTINDALRLLGDDQNQSYPIFRSPKRTEFNSITLCTAHFNFVTLEMVIYLENPKENNQTTFVYNLADLFV